MKKIAVYLFMMLTLNMIGALDAYALDFGKNMDIGIGKLLLLLALQIIFLLIGTRIAGIEHRTVAQVIWVTLGMIAIFFFMLVFTAEKDFQTIGIFVVGILAVFMIQRMFNTSLAKALGAFLFALIANVIAIVVIIPGII